jgi:hypothetical protein
MIVEAGRLTRHPADRPHFVVVAPIEPLVPTLADVEPHPFDPLLRSGGKRVDECGQI